jgi:signal transduction histidine kinase
LQTHPEKSEEIIHGIKRNATRLQRLTYDILDVAKIDSQSLKLNIERFNLNELISNILEDYRNQINNANVLLLYNPEKMSDDASSIFVEADKSRLSQVIYNLLSNASKFTKEGAISISVKKSIKGKKEAIVSIKDTGTGIHPEIFPKLFSKFVTKSDTEGTGLGLYISKNIIEAHGGKMWAENNNAYDVKGRGSIFRFSIPLNNNNNNNTKDYLNEKGTADKTDNRPMR